MMEDRKQDRQSMLGSHRKSSPPDLSPVSLTGGGGGRGGRGVNGGMGGMSVVGVVAMGTFLVGLFLFLVALASSDWLGIERGLALSLWTTCSRSYRHDEWKCEPWERIPDFVRAAQGFSVVGLLTYAMSVVMLVAYLALPWLHDTRALLIALCLLTFSAGSMILMAVIVMGVKGRDFCDDIKRDTWRVLRYFAEGVDTLGPFYVGWSFLVAVVAALFTLASFGFCMVEFIRVNDVVE